jgi:hypothetical protein
MTHTIPVGTSEPQDFELRNNGVALDGSTLDVALEMVAIEGSTLPETVPTVGWLNRAAGTVRVTGVETLPVGGYRVRYKLTDAGSKIGFCPNGAKADIWQVVALHA